MLTWLNTHKEQIALVLLVVIVLVFGAKKVIPRVGESKVLLWLIFVVYVGCGLVLGFALRDVARWITGLGTFGGVIASVGAIAAVAAGWWSIHMLVAAVRDVLDGKPDEEARKAALWIPTLVPAGFAAAWGLVQNPRGVGTGISALIIAGISVIFLHRTTKAALKAQKFELPWKWFAVAVSIIAGILMIPLYQFADSQLAQYAGDWTGVFRIVVGGIGLALLVWCIGDAWPKKSKNETTIVPDAGVRTFAAFGVPALFLFGALAFGAAEDAASQQGDQVVGTVQK